jgi:hypothetical protein
VSARSWIVLQFHRKVIQTSFLIVKRTVVALVKLSADEYLLFLTKNYRGCLRGLSAQTVARSIVDNQRGRNGLTS